MEQIIRSAHYIKLGSGGKWAHESIEAGILRFGWFGIPLAEIHAGDWASIRKRLGREHKNKGTVTSDTERLRDLVTSTTADIWITFHNSHLWWGRLSTDAIQEDATSRYRTLAGGWRDTDVSGAPLTISRIPGVIAQLQGFRGTVCSVRDNEALARLVNAKFSPAYKELEASHRRLIKDVQAAIRGLHWKDFEVLVDLVFRQAGWKRRSMLGESMKYVDLELVEPITREAYQVQIKSKATLKQFKNYAEQFSREGFRKLYFVVHSPSSDLGALENKFDDLAEENIELVLPPRLGELVVEAGLVGWVLDKVR
jgi:hypothetical protein